MNTRILAAVVWYSICCASFAAATTPELVLGPKPSFGLFQPRVSVEIFEDAAGTQSLGPNANSFLLDTGANGTLIYSPAINELVDQGYVIEGQVMELGVSGVETFDVSRPYRLNYSGTSGTEHINDVRFLSNEGGVDPSGLLGLNGIVGMQAMEGRVVTIDNTTRDNALTLSMGVTFSDSLPNTTNQRFSVPLTPLDLPFEEDAGLIPTFGSLSTLPVTGRGGGNEITQDLVLDTGAQMTIISEEMAFSLGLDRNGNGDLSDDSSSSVPIGGVGGTVNAPVFTVEELSVMTDQGFKMVWRDADVLVRDIHPDIQGVVGADFMTGDGGLDLTAVSGGGLGDLGDLLGGDLGSLFGDLLGGGGGGLGDLLGGGGLDDLLGGLLGGGGGLGDLLGGLGGAGGTNDLFGGLGGISDLFGGGEVLAADTGEPADPLSDLLGGGLLGGGLDSLLGGLLGGTGSDVFAAFPLESYFDRVIFDFRGFPDGEASVIWELRPDLTAAILNGDGRFDAADIDAFTLALQSGDAAFDLNSDTIVDATDRDLLITAVLGTTVGDTDLDKDVDFADFLTLSSNFGDLDVGWADGDLDGNGQIDFGDFLLLTENFGSAGSTSPVPEPDGRLIIVIAALWTLRHRSRVT